MSRDATAAPARLRWATAVALAGAIALAGCGGSGSSGSDTRAAFVSAADHICTQESAELRHYKVNSTAALLRDAPGQIRLESAANEKLAALKPPAALSADWRTIIAHYRAATRDYQALETDVHTRANKAAVKVSSAGREEVLGAHELAAQDGLTACSKV